MQNSFRKSFANLHKAAMISKEKLCTKLQSSLRFGVVVVSTVQSTLSFPPMETPPLSLLKTSEQGHGLRNTMNGCARFPIVRNPHQARQPVARLDSALNAPLNAVSTAEATIVRTQNWGSLKPSFLYTPPLFAKRVRGVAGHEAGRSTDDLLKFRSHRRAEAVRSSAAFGAHRSIICKRGEAKTAKKAQHIPNFYQKLQCSSQWTLSRLLVWARHGSDEDQKNYHLTLC